MGDTLDLRQYIAIGLKWWWVVVLMTATAGIAGYLFSINQEAVYQATTTIIVGQSMTPPSISISLPDRSSSAMVMIVSAPLISVFDIVSLPVLRLSSDQVRSAGRQKRAQKGLVPPVMLVRRKRRVHHPLSVNSARAAR